MNKFKFIILFLIVSNLVTELYIEKFNFFMKYRCYFPIDISNVKIIHIVITRFLTPFKFPKDFDKMIYNGEYIKNGIRVIKKYLLPSLEKQICKDFTWLIVTGNKNNINNIKSLLNLKTSFNWEIIHQNNLKKYLRNASKGFDVLITSRIDYDDRIYYDAVNDVRKSINLRKPMVIYGYNRGGYYFESNGKYYDYYVQSKIGALGIFLSLITVLKRVNDSYSIFEIGPHPQVSKILKRNYKYFGINKLDYEPGIFDTGSFKFVYVRQKYSHSIKSISSVISKTKPINFNLNKFLYNKI